MTRLSVESAQLKEQATRYLGGPVVSVGAASYRFQGAVQGVDLSPLTHTIGSSIAALPPTLAAGLSRLPQLPNSVDLSTQRSGNTSSVSAVLPLYTGGAEIPSNEVLLYWMETGDLGLRWPKYYAGYIHAWPTDLAKYSMYMRSLDAATATAVPLNAADNPALVYQDDPTKAHAAVSADLKFSTTVTAAARAAWAAAMA